MEIAQGICMYDYVQQMHQIMYLFYLQYLEIEHLYCHEKLDFDS